MQKEEPFLFFLKKRQLGGCHFLFLRRWFPEKQLHFCVLLFRYDHRPNRSSRGQVAF